MQCEQDGACRKCMDRIRSIPGRGRGRVTREREAIMKVICNYQGHFTAEDLALAVAKTGSKISLPTIYRNLPVLLEAGIIRRTGLFDEPSSQAATYEHVFGRPHHDHLICSRCGIHLEFSYPAIQVLQEAVAREHGFELQRHHMEIVGVCAACRAAEGAPEEAS